MAKSDTICVAQIGAAHGIRGEVRVKPFTAEPQAMTEYGPLADDKGRLFRIAAHRPSKSLLVVKFRGINSRNDAEALNGVRLFVPRDRLPALEDQDEFYHTDLIGLAAIDPNGTALGTVIAVQDYGAGDLLEIRPASGRTRLVPFTHEAVPEIRFDDREVVVDYPDDPEPENDSQT